MDSFLVRQICVVLAFLYVIAPVHAQKTAAQLQAEINANWPDNTTNEITPALLRAPISDIVSSIMPAVAPVSGNLACFNGTTGLLQDCGKSPTSVVSTISGDCTATTSGVITCTKTGGVLLGPLATLTAIGSGLKISGTTLVSGPGVENVAGATTPTSAPTITSANCGNPVALGGAALYTTTVGAASGFPAGCELIFINTDPWPTGSSCSALTGGRGKVLSVSGLTVPMLWPKQTYKFRNIASAWYQDPAYQRVVVPLGQKFCFDLAGSNASDGFGTGSNAMLTLNQGWFNAWTSFQSAGGSATGGSADYDFRLLNDASCNTTTAANCHSGLHFSGALPGTEGHNAVMVECDSGVATNCTIADTANSAIGVFNAGINMEIQNVTLSGLAASNALITAERGMVRVQSGVNLASAGSSSPQVQALQPSGYVIFEGGSTNTISGGGNTLATASAGGTVQLDSATFSFANNVAYTTNTLAAVGLGLLTGNAITWTLNSHTVTAPHNIGCSTLGMMILNGGQASVPGTNTPASSCTNSGSGNYN